VTAGAGGPELGAIEVLVTALREATGATAGTFTEYGRKGGRVVVAQGGMAWALGQPVPEQLVAAELIERPFRGSPDAMPPDAAEPLLARDLRAIVGHPVRAGERVVGALHLFFAGLAPDEWTDVAQVLAVAAAFADRVYTGRDAAPVRSPDEEDDRSLFLAVAGHELRTPVTVIKGYASLLADRWDSLDEQERRSAAAVLTQRADELAVLVERLLRAPLGGGSAGGLVRRVPFDPADALARAVEGMPAQLRAAVRVEVPGALPPACGDPDAVGAVVTELVTNAVRASAVDWTASPAGGSSPAEPSTVDLRAGSDADTVYIRVLDRGTGIEPSDAEHAFEQFWRGDRADRGGIGLGLYLVRRLVERQNGWVSLRPRDGGGTVAEVRLARADGPGPPGKGPWVSGEA
jgi:signal transduction histidine kinase